MADYQTIEALSTDLRGMTLVARASGNPITAGTVNWYLKALSGANSGKWWRTSDGTWQVAETANAMTHHADGHWTRDPVGAATSPFADGVLFLEYAKESGDLHIPCARHLRAAHTPSADSSKRVDVGSLSDAAIARIGYVVSVGTVAASPAPTATAFRLNWSVLPLTGLPDTSGYNDQLIRITSGTLTGQVRPILTYTKVDANNADITLEEGLTAAPTAGNTFAIHAIHVHPVSQIQSGLARLVDLATLEEMTEGARDVARAGAAVGSVGEAINLILSKTDTEIDGLVTSIATLTTDIATILASVTPEVASILAAVGVIQAKTDQMQFTNENKVDAALVAVEDLLAAVANKIADHVRRRSQASVESSPDGDALSVGSEYGFIQQAQKSTNNGTGLDVKKTTGAALGTLPLTTDENAEPITGVG